MPYQAVTLATLRTRLQHRYGASAFWSNEEARLALNEALRYWNLFTGRWRTRVTLATTAGTVWYSVPSSLVVNAQMAFGESPMGFAALTGLDRARPNWEAETTATGGAVPTRPAVWSPAGWTRFAIWPADAVGGTTLVIDGVRATPTLVLDADFVDLGESEHHALIGYALHVLSFKRGGEFLRSTLPLYAHFLQALADQNDRLRATSFYRTAMLMARDRVLRPDRLPAGPLPPWQAARSTVNPLNPAQVGG